MSGPTPIPQPDPPLWAPDYRIGLTAAVGRYFKKYADFTGRAGLREFWFVTLVQVILGLVFWLLAMILGLGTVIASNRSPGDTASIGGGVLVILGLYSLWSLATLVPSLALVWRRLHDTNRHGAWFFITLVPLVGAIILLVFLCGYSNPTGTRYDVPLEGYDIPGEA